MSATQRSLGSDLGPRLRPFARAIAGSINRRRCCESSETGPSCSNPDKLELGRVDWLVLCSALGPSPEVLDISFDLHRRAIPFGPELPHSNLWARQ